MTLRQYSCYVVLRFDLTIIFFFISFIYTQEVNSDLKDKVNIILDITNVITRILKNLLSLIFSDLITFVTTH